MKAYLKSAMKSKLYFNPTWATTRQGLNISLWASNPPEPSLLQKENSPILFIGGVHGDEPEGVWLAEAFLNRIKTHHIKQSHAPSQLRSIQPWVIIPCLNPEGYSRLERTNSAGVDLNRNFPSPDWSPEAKAPRYFPGIQPGTEPEVQAVLQATEIYKPKLIIHFHSWKPCVVYTGKPAEPIARLLSDHSGYPMHEDIGYPTPGSLGQYGWLSLKTPVICIEEQEGISRDHIWRRFQWALMDLIK
jgi:protein MpaA